MATVLRDRPAVPIAKTGTWKALTGEWTCTRDMLRDAVLAQHDPAFRAAVLKVGHLDSRFTDGELLGDGEPAVGRVINLRLDETGTVLLADFVGIPAWLDEIMESAYPSRSMEAAMGVTTEAGAKYSMVITGCALLGVTAPAIQSLGDLASLYGVDTTVESYVAASRVAASALPEETRMPVRKLGHVVASASIDELTSAFEDHCSTMPMLGGDCWVRDIYTDYLVCTVWLSGGDSKMYRCTWSEADGAFTFGDPEAVRPTYEPVPATTAQAMMSAGVPLLASDVIAGQLHCNIPGAVLSARGRDVTAGAHPNEESSIVPISPALAELLGVAVDADEQAVEAAAKALREKADAPPPATAQSEESGTTETAPVETPDVAQLVAAAVAPFQDALKTTSTELAALKADKVAGIKASVIGSAITKGKIRPSDRATFEAQYDAAPDAITAVLAALADGTAIQVAASGVPGEPVMSSELDAEWAKIAPYFGEKAVS